MELLQLEYFYAVAQNQHMTRTAEQLHIAQPSLTQSIRRLEKELGVPLFYRSGRNIALTTYGEALQNALTPVLKTLHQIPTQLQQMALEREKTIRLNVLAASTLVTQALISYKKDHDGLHFRLIQNSQCEDADITVFTRENFQIPTDTKERYELFKERIFLAVPHNSPYASEESVRLQDFAHEDFISLSGSRSIRTICDRYCMQAGFVPHIIYESDSPGHCQKPDRQRTGSRLLAALYVGHGQHGADSPAAYCGTYLPACHYPTAAPPRQRAGGSVQLLRLSEPLSAAAESRGTALRKQTTASLPRISPAGDAVVFV